MESPTTLPTRTIPCSQCGGELHPDEGQLFLTCPFCSATVYLDKSRVVFHWYLAPTLNAEQARANLGRWMAGNQTVKDLDRKASLLSTSFNYFPMWYFKSQVNGREEIHLEPAAATSITELRHLRLQAGDLRKYADEIQPQSVEPTVPLESALGWALPGGEVASAGPAMVLETALVHLPVYTFKYSYLKRTYTALVEGATGTVIANLFPAKAEAPYQVAGLVTGAVYVGLGLLPILGNLIGQNSGTMLGVGLCVGLGLLAAPLLFAYAAWVAAKV